MDEQKTEEEEKPETPAEDKGEGDKYETTPIIERARQEREAMDASTKAAREENDRTERIMAKKALGGETTAGQVPEKPKEETPKEYKDRVMGGEL